MTGGDGIVSVDKEMSISHREFFRTLPRALGSDAYRLDDGAVRLDDGARRLEVVVGPEGERRIGLLTLPVTRVRLSFIGYGGTAAREALARFDRAFQRGGG